MKVDVNEVLRLKTRLEEINRLKFSEIEWVDGDKLLEIEESIKKEWKFIGLSNADFIWIGDYLRAKED